MLSKIGMWSSVAMTYSCIHSKFQVNCMKNEFFYYFFPIRNLSFQYGHSKFGSGTVIILYSRFASLAAILLAPLLGCHEIIISLERSFV